MQDTHKIASIKYNGHSDANGTSAKVRIDLEVCPCTDELLVV